ncbi:MAG: hypothetical protein A3B68_09810 [Candidatus Melainabacteria bacterium RIFCSPHIGHO2_02_FULL_34_12]|nr:MAG: hypothetical protein A3B68_09810 [Candidatus Melainabacteria bacterium RIFCSPHIGHO2_02_FULL_34_12]
MVLDAEVNSRKEYTNFWRSFSDINPRHQAGINEEEAFKVITDVKNRDKNLADCLSGIKNLTPYLSCSNEEIKNYAAQVVSALLSKASNFSSSKPDSDVFISFSQSILNKGLMDISPDEFVSSMEKATNNFIGETQNTDFSLVKNVFNDLGDSINRITESFKDSWVKLVVQLIFGAELGVSSLDSALDAIKSVSKYLSYDNEEIKTVAVKAIINLIERAADYLGKETNPQKILKAAAILLGVIQALGEMHSKGQINLSGMDFKKLSNAIEIIFEKMRLSKDMNELKLNDFPSDNSGCKNKYSCNNPGYLV